jgi:hypothetical protein
VRYRQLRHYQDTTAHIILPLLCHNPARLQQAMSLIIWTASRLTWLLVGSSDFRASSAACLFERNNKCSRQLDSKKVKSFERTCGGSCLTSEIYRTVRLQYPCYNNKANSHALPQLVHNHVNERNKNSIHWTVIKNLKVGETGISSRRLGSPSSSLGVVGASTEKSQDTGHEPSSMSLTMILAIRACVDRLLIIFL